MASYGMTNGAASGHYGGGWGNDIAGFGHAAYAGMSNGMQFANNLYDLQRRVALEPYAQNAAIANYNANTKQDEVSADVSGEIMRNFNRLRALTDGNTTANSLAGNGKQGVPQAAIQGAATNVVANTNTGTTVGAAPVVAVVPATTSPSFEQTLMGKGVLPKQTPWNNGEVLGVPPTQPNMSYPVNQSVFQPTAPVVESQPQAYVDRTIDPTPAPGAWVQNRWYGQG